MFCGNCGNKIENGSRFCAVCGAQTHYNSIQTNTVNQPVKKFKTGKWIGILIGISFAVFFLMTILKLSVSIYSGVNINSDILAIIQITVPMLIIMIGIPAVLIIGASNKK